MGNVIYEIQFANDVKHTTRNDLLITRIVEFVGAHPVRIVKRIGGIETIIYTWGE
jgi:hypothetical protein